MSNIYIKKPCICNNSRCLGFLCPDFKNGCCQGSIKSIFDTNGNFIASVRPLAFEDEDIEEVLMEAFEKLHSRGYLTNQEVVEVLKRKYGIKITKDKLRYYSTERFIEGGFRRRIPGRKGTVSFYKDNTPERIYFTRYLKNFYRFKLKKISEYSKILCMENDKKLDIYKKYKIGIIKGKDGREIIQLGEWELVNDLADFQEFSILRALFEVGKLNYKQKQPLPFDSTVVITKDKNGKDNIVVRLGENINKKVVFSSNGVVVK